MKKEKEIKELRDKAWKAASHQIESNEPLGSTLTTIAQTFDLVLETNEWDIEKDINALLPHT